MTAWLARFAGLHYFDTCANGNGGNGGAATSFNNFFCIDCEEGPLCSNEHKEHRRLQVRKCSKQIVVNVKDIEEYCSVASICVYVINGEPVVFLPSRPQSHNSTGRPANDGSYCEGCSRFLKPPVDKRLKAFKYCSITCKLQITGKQPVRVELQGGKEQPGFKEQPKLEPLIVKEPPELKLPGLKELPNNALPIRKRKGRPCRAPFGDDFSSLGWGFHG